MLGLESNPEFKGIVLHDGTPKHGQRTRYFHMTRWLNRQERTTVVDRYRIEDGTPVLEKTIRSRNNVRP